LKKTNRTGQHGADVQNGNSNAGKGKLSRCVQTHQASIEWELCTLSVDVNQPERENGTSSISTTEFKNAGTILHSPPYVFQICCSFHHSENFSLALINKQHILFNHALKTIEILLSPITNYEKQRLVQ
jgi:hypothetical protein